MALKVDSGHTMPQERAKHDPIGPAQVVVGAWVALQAVVRSVPHGHFTLPPPPREASPRAHRHTMVLGETGITFEPGRVVLIPAGCELQYCGSRYCRKQNGIVGLAMGELI